MAVATKEQVASLIIGGRKLKGDEYIGAVEDVLTKNVKSAMDKLGVNLVNKLEEYTPVASGTLSSSYKVLGVKSTKSGYRLEIEVGADYHDYIDKGVKGIKNRRKVYKNAEGKYYQFKNYYMPPEALKSLEGWAKRKNIELDAQKKISKFEGKPSTIKMITSPAKTLAYFIKKYGIEGRNFKKRAFDDVTPDFLVEMQVVGFNSLVLKIIK